MTTTNPFSPIQWKVLQNATKRWNILYGATRSGKTRVSYFTSLIHLREHWNEPALFVGKTLNTLDRNVFDPMRIIFGDDNISPIRNNKEITIFSKRCYCVGANDERAITKIQGAGLGYAYLDELTTYPENFFQMLKSRLDTHGACCDATCNPESPSHFVKQFIDKAEADPNISIYTQHFTIYDNPYLDPDFVKSLEAEYKGTIYFDKWILGKWVKAEGLVYPLFRRDRHFMTPDNYASKYGKHRIEYVIWGVDGANTNDSTAIEPIAIMSNGQAVRLEHYYHNPKINGQISNEQQVPIIAKYLQDMERRYRFAEMGTKFVMPVDAGSSDLRITLAYHFPEFRPFSYTKKDLNQTTDIVNNAFARNSVIILNFGGYYNYYQDRFFEGDDQLVVDLELMTWNKNNEKFDDAVPNDCADAFRYALCTYYLNPDNLWNTPNEERYV